jgi:hypothetical protein
MAIDVKVGSVKAADPGLGFTLNFNSALGSTLRVVITMTDLQQPTKGNYTSEVTLHNTISDKELVFVVPFGDNDYAPSNCLKFQIDLYTPYDNANSLTPPLTGVVMGENGVFNFSTSVPTVVHDFPKTGDMLQSEDGAFIGIYQKDGNFCVYPQFADNQSSLNAVYATDTAVGGPTSFGMSLIATDLFQLVIQDSSGKWLARSSTSYSTQNRKSFSISSSGVLLVNNADPIFFRNKS